ncbi:MAG: hydroxysqualene dehydroxylase HpnE [Acidobacteriota bacterium]
MTSPDVIVVGAGMAGLSAATLLAERGAHVVVIEARPVLGGRAFSYRDPATGEAVDNGQHVLIGCYRESFAFLRRIGTEQHVRLQPALDVPYVDGAGTPTRLACPALPSPYHLLGGIMEWDALSWRDRLAALRMGPVLRTARRQLAGRTSMLAASPDETVENWLIRNGQTRRLRDLLWGPLTLAALNQPAGEAAAPAFVAVLGKMFGADARDSALGLSELPLSELYVEPARRYVESRGGTVLPGAPARVIVEGESAVGVSLRGGRTLRAAHVISAVPWHALAALFDEVPEGLQEIAGHANGMKAYPIVTVNVWFDREVLSSPFVGLPGRTFQWVFAKRYVFARATSHLSLVCSGAAPIVCRDNDALVNLALTELREALPRSREAKPVRASVVRERRATFSLAPGQPERPGAVTPLSGFCLAGDWTDTGLPGTIEGAAMSGHTAARLLR